MKKHLLLLLVCCFVFAWFPLLAGEDAMQVNQKESITLFTFSSHFPGCKTDTTEAPVRKKAQKPLE